jgi:hypothetical protein
MSMNHSVSENVITAVPHDGGPVLRFEKAPPRSIGTKKVSDYRVLINGEHRATMRHVSKGSTGVYCIADPWDRPTLMLTEHKSGAVVRCRLPEFSTIIRSMLERGRIPTVEQYAIAREVAALDHGDMLAEHAQHARELRARHAAPVLVELLRDLVVERTLANRAAAIAIVRDLLPSPITMTGDPLGPPFALLPRDPE